MSQEVNTKADLEKEQENLDRLLAKTNSRIEQCSRQRTDRLVLGVESFLPALTKSVLRRLEREFPDFLTDARRDVFSQHGNVFFGLFERSTTAVQLQQLRLWFRVYLEVTDFCQDLDDELRGLATQRVNLTRELQNVTRLLASAKRVNVIPGERPVVNTRPSHSIVVGQTRRGMSIHTSVHQSDVVDIDASDDGFANGVMLAAVLDSQPDPVVVTQDGPVVQGGYEAPYPGTGNSADGGASISDFEATAAAAADAGAPPACVIDTSDSLGAFS